CASSYTPPVTPTSTSYSHHYDIHSFPTRRSSDLSSAAPTTRRNAVGTTLSPRRGTRRPNTDSTATASCEPPRSGCAEFPVTVKRSEEHTSELQSRFDVVCRLLLEK